MKPGNSGGGKGPQLKADARSNEGHWIDINDESSYPELSSEVADGVKRNVTRVGLFREPDAGNLPVLFWGSMSKIDSITMSAPRPE
jgi:hypothetical protein